MNASLQNLVLGTQEGVYCLTEGSVHPLGEDRESILVLTNVGNREILAATESGSLFRSGGNATEWQRVHQLPDGDAIGSLLTIPGSPERVVAGTRRGAALVSHDSGFHFEPQTLGTGGPAGKAAALHFQGIANLPQAVLAISPTRGLCVSLDRGESFESRVLPKSVVPTRVAVHPLDAHVWTMIDASGLLRSQNAGVSFEKVFLFPMGSRPLDLAFEPAPPYRLWVLTTPFSATPQSFDPSPLWYSLDAGLTLRFVESSLTDRPRDPTGEIQVLGFATVKNAPRLLYATNRGELLELEEPGAQARVLVVGLPPIHALLRGSPHHHIDPSTSGIHLLP